MQSTQPLNSAQPPKEADPHDVFAIESILAARADHRAPPLAQDPASQPAAPQVHVAPEISVTAAAPQVEPVLHAIDVRNIQVESLQSDEIRVDEIRVDDLKPAGEKLAPKWMKRVVMGLLGLCGAIAAAAWQHYGDHAKAMAVSWAPQSVLAVLSPSETPPTAEPAVAPAIQPAAADQAAPAEQPATPVKTEQGRRTGGVGPFDGVGAVAVDGAGSRRDDQAGRGTESQHRAFRTSHAQMAREVAKAADEELGSPASRTSPASPGRSSTPAASSRDPSTARAASAAAGPSRVHPACPAIAAAGRCAGAARAAAATG